MRKLLTILWLFAMISCVQSKHQPNINTKAEQTVDSLDLATKEFFDSISLEWRRDTCGCHGFRDVDITEQIIKYYKLLENDTTQILKHLGNPNTISRGEANGQYEIHYCYIIAAPCYDGKYYGEGDCEFLVFGFYKDGKLLPRPYNRIYYIQ